MKANGGDYNGDFWMFNSTVDCKVVFEISQNQVSSFCVPAGFSSTVKFPEGLRSQAPPEKAKPIFQR